MPNVEKTYSPAANIRALDYKKGNFVTKSGHIKPDATNYPEGFPRGLILAKFTAGADQGFLVPYDSTKTNGQEIPVGVLVESVTPVQFTEVKDNKNGTDAIRVEVDFKGAFIKNSLSGWDTNAKNVLGAKESGNIVYI